MPRPERARVKLSRLFQDCYVLEDGVPEFRMFIGGRWARSSTGRTLSVDSPIDDTVIARVQSASLSDVDAAVEAAYGSRKKIRDIPAIDRIDILNRARHIIRDHRDDFTSMLTLEAGKPTSSAVGEVSASLDRIKMTMEEARSIFGEYVPGDWSEDTMAKFALVIHEPVGVVACISPFNYPLFSVVAKVVPALVSGNATVVKPASDDPTVALLLARVFQEAGVPDGVLNVVTGPGRALGDRLVSHEHVNMVTMTGSTAVGKHVAGLVGMKKMHLELGGKGAAIVASDADLALASKKVLEGCLKYSGQRCDAISRVFAEEKVADEFLKLLTKGLQSWRVGDPRKAESNMGPLINPRAAERVQSLVDDAVSKGARLVAGGRHDRSYFEPTVLDLVPEDARIATEETFGPVVTIIRVSSVDEAIRFTNDSRYGLDSCVFTTSLYTAWKVAKALEEGTVTVNDAPAHGVGYFPFGGNKDSGLGREGVGYSVDEMTRIKTISFNLAPGGLGKTRQSPRM